MEVACYIPYPADHFSSAKRSVHFGQCDNVVSALLVSGGQRMVDGSAHVKHVLAGIQLTARLRHGGVVRAAAGG